MPIDPKRAFELAIAALGDSARVISQANHSLTALAADLRDARDYFIHLRDARFGNARPAPAETTGLHHAPVINLNSVSTSVPSVPSVVNPPAPLIINHQSPIINSPS